MGGPSRGGAGERVQQVLRRLSQSTRGWHISELLGASARVSHSPSSYLPWREVAAQLGTLHLMAAGGQLPGAVQQQKPTERGSPHEDPGAGGWESLTLVPFFRQEVLWRASWGLRIDWRGQVTVCQVNRRVRMARGTTLEALWLCSGWTRSTTSSALAGPPCSPITRESLPAQLSGPAADRRTTGRGPLPPEEVPLGPRQRSDVVGRSASEATTT